MIHEDNGRLYVHGPVKLENAMSLRAEVEPYFGRPDVLVDFSNVTEVDSAAVSLMLEWTRCGRAAGCKVQFVNLGEAIESLTDLYGVEDLIVVDKAR